MDLPQVAQKTTWQKMRNYFGDLFSKVKAIITKWWSQGENNAPAIHFYCMEIAHWIPSHDTHIKVAI